MFFWKATVPATVYDSTLPGNRTRKCFQTGGNARDFFQKPNAHYSQYFAAKSQFWGPWGSILAPSGSTLAPFSDPRPHFGHFWRPGAILVDFPHGFVLHLESILAPKITKIAKKLKKVVFGKRRSKNRLPKLTRNSPMCHPYSKYHML